MLTQIRLELFKLTLRGRSYIGFIGLLGITGLVVLAFKLGGPPFPEMSSSRFSILGSMLNGGFVSWFLLNMMVKLFLPLFVCVVTGDLISGEAAEGTLRSMLSRPVSRARLYASKFIAAVIYTAALTFFLGIASYIVGAVFLGRGVLITFPFGAGEGQRAIFVTESEVDGLMRLFGAYAFAGLSMLAVGSIAFFLSVLVTNSLGAIGGAMIAFIVFNLLGIISYFDPIKPYLFTTHIEAFDGFFVYKVAWPEIGKSALTLFVYIAAFAGAGFLIFRRKDVLS